MQHRLWILLAALVSECQGQDKVIQPAGDVIATEGHTATLDCTFETTDSSPFLFWYKQEVPGIPKFMLRRYSGGGDNAPEFQGERFHATANKSSVPLKIHKLQLNDSAVYYCALTPAYSGASKLIFGSGIQLVVVSTEEYAASYYKLKKDNVGVCLATGFSRFNTTKQSGRGDLFRDSQPVRISSDSLFNQVAQLQAGDEGKCEQGDSGPGRCEEALKQDEMVNMASLTVLGLRLLFLKTIVFNVLMTLRLWISH